MEGIPVWNWTHELVTYPQKVVTARSVDDIVRIVRDRSQYPSPVRAHGSRHTTSRCGEADGGTIVDMTSMNRIGRIEGDRVVAEAGAKYIDVAKALEQHDLQFYVNIELGNLSMGAAAITATKDASMPGEYGQVNSYCVGMKMVRADGEIVEITEEQPELLQAARSSYGLLGIVFEVTFKVRPLQAMRVKHQVFSLDDFTRQLPELIGRGQSMMMYIFPFLNRIVVEFRLYTGGEAETRKRTPVSHFAWRLRNKTWKTIVPWLNHTFEVYLPRFIRYYFVNALNRIAQQMMVRLLAGENTIPTDQMIRYPATSGASKYTFSIWGISQDRYADTLRAYFRFAQDYRKKHHYRPNMLHVGYRILKDQSSLFSYTYDFDVLTIDPVSTGEPGWIEFLKAYNDFCSEHGGTPLFNQTPWLTPAQARRAFGDRVDRFQAIRTRFDPDGRLYSNFWREILA
ncbi:MAG TPA: FAD-binding oxidoreductase [Vicinamibacterales bacterium]|nr:FAD-binding oxidoreductase [Vicinamibacterales bacterium]